MLNSRVTKVLKSKGRFISVSAALVAMAGTSVLLTSAPVAAAPSPSGPRLAPVPDRALVGTGAAAPSPNGEAFNSDPPWTQAAEITGNSGSGLGWTIGVSGGTMVVGAPFDNAGIGAAFVYTGSGTNWTEAAELTPSDGVANDFFGSSVAIRGDEIVVGAECHSATSPTCEGAAYVFTGSGSHWTQQAELDDPGMAAYDFFGWPVNISMNSILVSATGENSAAGAIFVYTLERGHWAEKSEIPDPAATAADLFGFSAQVASRTNLIVGAPGTSGSKGAAYLFHEVNGGWVRTATLTASNGAGCSTTCGASLGYVYGDYFGNGVALSGGTIAVGAPYASYPTPKPDSVGSGTAYVFTRSRGVWSQRVELADPAEYTVNDASPPGCTSFTSPCNAEDNFGFNVALAGTSVVAAAPEDPQGYPNSADGAVFVSTKTRGTWSSSSLSKLVASDAAVGNDLGYEGLTSIGANIVVVGSPYSSNGGIYFFKD